MRSAVGECDVVMRTDDDPIHERLRGEMTIPFVHIQARGTYRELGRAVGEGARSQIEASVEFFRENFVAMSGGLTFGEAERQAAAYLRYASRYLPQYVEELEGMAEGSRVPLPALLVLNCGEEFTAHEAVSGEANGAADGLANGAAESAADGLADDAADGAIRGRPSASGDHCTALAVVSRGRHVVAHNMDWYVVDAPNNVLFDYTLPDGTRLLTLAGAPYLPMLGMNSHGIGNVSNSMPSNDNRVGVPDVFVRRWSIEAASLEEARARGLLTTRARGTNHFLGDTQGRLWDIETSATAFAFLDRSRDSFMAHTNHYLAGEMAKFAGAEHEESRTRWTTAEQLLADGVAQDEDPVTLAMRVLRCHDPAPEEAICGHADTNLPVAEQGMTVGSIICDLDERRLYACAGPPCQTTYQVFAL